MAIAVVIVLGFNSALQKSYNHGYQDGLHDLSAANAIDTQTRIDIAIDAIARSVMTNVHCEGQNCMQVSPNTYPSQEISIITEKKDCDSKGGEFSILSNEIRVDAGVYTDAVAFKKASHNVYTLTCTSPAEEIFNIQVK